MKNLLTYLRSNSFALLVAILSVAVQSFHSFTAFYNTSSLRGSAWGIAQAVLFAVIIDLAILFYTLRKREDIAKLAALVMVVINAYYYYQAWGLSWTFAFGCFLSLIIPVSVYYYSEEIDDQDDNKARLPELLQAESEIRKLVDIIQQKETHLQASREHVAKRDLEVKRLSVEAAELKNKLVLMQGARTVIQEERAPVTVDEFREEEAVAVMHTPYFPGKEGDLKGPIISTGGPRDPIDEQI
jgi:hypothetical protein